MRCTDALFCIALLIWIAAAFAAATSEETFGCEANPTGDPIGGGEGYSDIFSFGDFTVRTAEELVDAFAKATSGQVIFVPDGIEIDLTDHSTLTIPAGVTLAGTRGLNGSLGARIFTKRKSGRMFSSGGDYVRLTGLRFEGPYAGAERVGDSAYFHSINSYANEVDNCEIYNFNVAGISVGNGALNTHIHHNYIHHCQRGGLGYGVSASSTGLRIIANKFDYCRHHIASSGSPGSSYEAAWNLVGPNATSHHFDMHGGRDRGDGTDIAGDWISIHHNTFQSPHRHVAIRGVPSVGADIHHNWFMNPAAKSVSTGGNTRVYRNVYGPERTLEE